VAVGTGIVVSVGTVDSCVCADGNLQAEIVKENKRRAAINFPGMFIIGPLKKCAFPNYTSKAP
jgi:hypothetical protein